MLFRSMAGLPRHGRLLAQSVDQVLARIAAEAGHRIHSGTRLSHRARWQRACRCQRRRLTAVDLGDIQCTFESLCITAIERTLPQHQSVSHRGGQRLREAELRGNSLQTGLKNEAGSAVDPLQWWQDDGDCQSYLVTTTFFLARSTLTIFSMSSGAICSATSVSVNSAIISSKEALVTPCGEWAACNPASE